MIRHLLVCFGLYAEFRCVRPSVSSNDPTPDGGPAPGGGGSTNTGFYWSHIESPDDQIPLDNPDIDATKCREECGRHDECMAWQRCPPSNAEGEQCAGCYLIKIRPQERYVEGWSSGFKMGNYHKKFEWYGIRENLIPLEHQIWDEASCKNECDARENCKAWQLLPDIPLSLGCYLIGGDTAPVMIGDDADSIAAVKPDGFGRGFNWEDIKERIMGGVELVVSDMEETRKKNRNWEQCRAECGEEPNCVGWQVCPVELEPTIKCQGCYKIESIDGGAVPDLHPKPHYIGGTK